MIKSHPTQNGYKPTKQKRNIAVQTTNSNNNEPDSIVSIILVQNNDKPLVTFAYNIYIEFMFQRFSVYSK